MRNLRFLVYSNPLIADKISKKFIYWKDSGFIFSKNLIKSLPSDYRFSWVVPDKLNENDYEWFLSANKNVDLVPYPFSTGIHQNRYTFSTRTLSDYFPYTTDIDVIISNQPEVSANLWTWAYNQRRELPILLSFFHWIDCAKSRQFSPILGGYFFRQFDGCLSSDAAYFHGEYAKKLFRDEAELWGVDDSSINYKSFFPPPTEFGTDPIELPKDKKIILFNHRLNNTTNWKKVIEILSSLYDRRQDFVLWMTDENRNLANSKFLQSIPFVINKFVPDNNYGYLIQNSHFSLCSHKGYSTWNMAVLDAIYNGSFVIVPDDKDDVYVTMFSDEDVFYDRNYLSQKIDVLLDTSKEELHNKQQVLLQHISYLQTRSNHVDDDISEFISSRIRSSHPKKYLDVSSFIKSEDGVYKRDWVNKYWSFHTNSNFQLIRWKLLQDGIIDDTSSKESLYRKVIQ